MNKKRIYKFALIIAGILLVGGGALFKASRDGANRSNSGEQPAPASLDDSSADAPKPAMAVHILSDDISPTGRVVVATRAGVTNQLTLPLSADLTEDQIKDMIFDSSELVSLPPRPAPEAYNQHLFFYGLVVDGESNVVQGARVEATVLIAGPGIAKRDQPMETATGPDGRFSLDAAWGQKISVRVVKQGFIPSEWRYFVYGPVDSPPYHMADVSNPALFVLHEDIEIPDLIYLEQTYQAPNDGTPVRIDLISGQIVQQEGDIIISIHCPEPYTNLKQFPWSLSVQAPAGGMVPVAAVRFENLHEAPHGGYQPGLKVEHGPESLNYSRQHDGMYFIASRNGQVFSKMFLTVRTRWDERGVPFSIAAYVNKNGSRNLRSQHLWKGVPVSK
jgi:hypothetical protein